MMTMIDRNKGTLTFGGVSNIQPHFHPHHDTPQTLLPMCSQLSVPTNTVLTICHQWQPPRFCDVIRQKMEMDIRGDVVEAVVNKKL